MARSRRRTACWTIAVAAVLAACVDGPTTPGRYGELRIRPRYAVGDEPGLLGIQFDSAAVRVVRRGTSDAPLLDTRVAYGSDTASLAWIVDLEAAAESLLVDVTLWGGGTRYYDGGDTVEVRDALLDVAAAPVPVGYVGPAIVASVAVSPDVDTLRALGASTPLAAVARDRHDVIVTGAPFTWTSGAADVAAVDALGGVTANGNGTATITARTGNVTGTATIVVRQRVTQLAITPGDITLTRLGATELLDAQARDANGHLVADAAVVWTSNGPEVASVDAATGLVTALAGGTAMISAASGGVTTTARVTVNPIANVATIVVSPVVVTLTNVGATRQFSAEARDASGAALPGVEFIWISAAPGVATVDAAGLVRAAGHGTAQITASAGAVSGFATVTVDLTATITSVTVSPATATLDVLGATRAFTAEARDAGGAVVPVTQFAWTSSALDVAAVDPATGVARATGHGTAGITATAGLVSGTATLTVDLTATIATVTVEPSSATLLTVGATQAFTAVARDAAGIVVPVAAFEWSTAHPAVATVSALGVATAVSHGETAVTATVADVSGSATLVVNLAATVTSVTVKPVAATLTELGATQQFSAEARDASGFVVPGIAVVWSVASTAVATIDPATGLATASGHGTTTVTAAAGSVSGTAVLTVNLATTIVSVTVTPSTATLTTVGATQTFTAVARDAGGAVVPVTQFAWSSSTPDVAAVHPASGVATALAAGTAVITAAVEGVSGIAALTVTLAPVVASVTVTPSYVTLKSRGATQAYTAVARDAGGAVVPGVEFAWTSTSVGVATVDPVTGVATAVANGTTTIRATTGGVNGTATLKVQQKVVSVVVTPHTATLVGKQESQQFTAQAFDANGHVVPGVTFSWSSTSPSVATVSSTGLAKPCGYGTTKIKATVGYVTGYATLTVKRAY